MEEESEGVYGYTSPGMMEELSYFLLWRISCSGGRQGPTAPVFSIACLFYLVSALICAHLSVSYHIHAYIHTYIHTYLLTYILTYLHTYIHPCIHTYIHPCIHTYIHTYRPRYIFTLYIYIYVCVCANMWIIDDHRIVITHQTTYLNGTSCLHSG